MRGLDKLRGICGYRDVQDLRLLCGPQRPDKGNPFSCGDPFLCADALDLTLCA